MSSEAKDEVLVVVGLSLVVGVADAIAVAGGIGVSEVLDLNISSLVSANVIRSLTLTGPRSK
ncbi:hypothetical protein JCM17380_03870 [Desulfosporosinus burensis]